MWARDSFGRGPALRAVSPGSSRRLSPCGGSLVFPAPIPRGGSSVFRPQYRFQYARAQLLPLDHSPFGFAVPRTTPRSGA